MIFFFQEVRCFLGFFVVVVDFSGGTFLPTHNLNGL